jgi:hypothetical protein
MMSSGEPASRVPCALFCYCSWHTRTVSRAWQDLVSGIASGVSIVVAGHPLDTVRLCAMLGVVLHQCTYVQWAFVRSKCAFRHNPCPSQERRPNSRESSIVRPKPFDTKG